MTRKAGEAVLRGAHAFAPGVLAVSKGLAEGDAVAVSIAREMPGAHRAPEEAVFRARRSCARLVALSLACACPSQAGFSVPQAHLANAVAWTPDGVAYLPWAGQRCAYSGTHIRACAAGKSGFGLTRGWGIPAGEGPREGAGMDRSGYFVGVGTVKFSRRALFAAQGGVAVELQRRVFEAPSLGGASLTFGARPLHRSLRMSHCSHVARLQPPLMCCCFGDVILRPSQL